MEAVQVPVSYSSFWDLWYPSVEVCQCIEERPGRRDTRLDHPSLIEFLIEIGMEYVHYRQLFQEILLG